MLTSTITVYFYTAIVHSRTNNGDGILPGTNAAQRRREWTPVHLAPSLCASAHSTVLGPLCLLALALRVNAQSGPQCVFAKRTPMLQSIPTVQTCTDNAWTPVPAGTSVAHTCAKWTPLPSGTKDDDAWTIVRFRTVDDALPSGTPNVRFRTDDDAWTTVRLRTRKVT